MAIIYLLTNMLNNKHYVGKTVRSLDTRWSGHVGSARREDTSMLISRAIKKHGVEAFERKVLEECDEADLGNREVHWIEALGTHVSQGGYNLTLGGDGGLPGHVFSEESKEKIRQKALGRKHSEETKAKMRAAKLGKKQKLEHVARRAESNSGKKRTEEQKARISMGQKLSGCTHSEETRKRISDASRGRVTSKETKKKLSESCTGWKQSDEVKQRISKSRSKSIAQCSLDGAIINIFPSIKVAANSTGFGYCTIQRGLTEKRVTRGFRWTYQ